MKDKYCYSRNGELYHGFDKDIYDRNEAIVAAFEEIWFEGIQDVYIGKEKQRTITAYVDAEDIFDRANEAAQDQAGESAEDWPDMTDANKKDLNELLEKWATDTNNQPTFWEIFDDEQINIETYNQIKSLTNKQ